MTAIPSRFRVVSLAVAAVAVVAITGLAVALLLDRDGRDERPRVVVGDFETSLSPWGHGSAASPSGGLSLATAPVAHGRRSLRSSVRLGICIPADQAPDGSCGRYHSNAIHKGRHYEGEEAWWGWSIFLPADWKPNVLSWNLLAQFHSPASPGPDTCQPNISLGTAGPGMLFVRSRGGPFCEEETLKEARFPVGSLGRWHRVVWRVRFSSTSDGLVEGWWDGEKVAALAGPTLYGHLRYVYGPMLGIYEGGQGAVAQTVFYDYVVTGGTYDAVAAVPETSS